MKKLETIKLPKGVTQEFVDSLNNMLIADLQHRIIMLQLQNQDNEEFKLSDKFIAAKEEYDLAKDKFELVIGPVREVTVSLKNRTKLVIKRLKEKGGA